MAKDRSAIILQKNLLNLVEFKNPNLAKKIREEADKAIKQSSDNSKDVSKGSGFHVTLAILGLALFATIVFEIYTQMSGRADVPYIKDLGMISLGALVGLVVIPYQKSKSLSMKKY